MKSLYGGEIRSWKIVCVGGGFCIGGEIRSGKFIWEVEILTLKETMECRRSRRNAATKLIYVPINLFSSQGGWGEVGSLSRTPGRRSFHPGTCKYPFSLRWTPRYLYFPYTFFEEFLNIYIHHRTPDVCISIQKF